MNPCAAETTSSSELDRIAYNENESRVAGRTLVVYSVITTCSPHLNVSGLLKLEGLAGVVVPDCAACVSITRVRRGGYIQQRQPTR